MAHAGHAAAFRGRTSTSALSRSRIAAATKRTGIVLLTLLALCALWELYRWVWVSTGWTRPFPVNDTTLPHIYTIFQAFKEASQSTP